MTHIDRIPYPLAPRSFLGDLYEPDEFWRDMLIIAVSSADDVNSLLMMMKNML